MTCLDSISKMRLGSRKYLRSLDVAEARSPDLHVRVRLQSNVADLSTNMLALAITIGPDE